MHEVIDKLVSSAVFNGYIGLMGLTVAIVGFCITVIQINKTKKSAESANESAIQTQLKIRRVMTVTDMSSVISAMDEIKRLHRLEEYVQLPDRYSYLRRKLVLIRAENHALAEEDVQTLNDAIAQLATFESNMERKLVDDSVNINVPKTNKLVSQTIDQLVEIITRLQSESGANNE